jgi:hypothetical protein
MSIVWSSVELITQYLTRHKAVKRYRGIHPGVHIGMHLGLTAGQGTLGSAGSGNYCSSGSETCTGPEIGFAVGAFAFVLW